MLLLTEIMPFKLLVVLDTCWPRMHWLFGGFAASMATPSATSSCCCVHRQLAWHPTCGYDARSVRARSRDARCDLPRRKQSLRRTCLLLQARPALLALSFLLLEGGVASTKLLFVVSVLALGIIASACVDEHPANLGSEQIRNWIQLVGCVCKHASCTLGTGTQEVELTHFCLYEDVTARLTAQRLLRSQTAWNPWSFHVRCRSSSGTSGSTATSLVRHCRQPGPVLPEQRSSRTRAA
mmetsp:Transcript_899/g.1750  ORF Transcript_899/g.1750 Transcript_899/m.1750 type:complete len:238 (+) Transcript_899:665-1378(+)